MDPIFLEYSKYNSKLDFSIWKKMDINVLLTIRKAVGTNKEAMDYIRINAYNKDDDFELK